MSESLALVSSVPCGSRYVNLTGPVPIPSYITLSPGQDNWEQQAVYRCTGDGPYTAWLGLSEEVRARVFGPHCAGTPVTVTEGRM
jgi:hypothetical protein